VGSNPTPSAKWAYLRWVNQADQKTAWLWVT